MLINNSYSNQTSFKGIKIENGGIDFVKKEGAYALARLEEVKDGLKKYNWHLNISPDNYSLTSPTTKKTYKGPFSIKRHIVKKADKPDEYTVIVRMNDKNREKYIVNFDSPQEAFQAYREVKHSSGIDKMIKLLEILEKGFKFRYLSKIISNNKNI